MTMIHKYCEYYLDDKQSDHVNGTFGAASFFCVNYFPNLAQRQFL